MRISIAGLLDALLISAGNHLATLPINLTKLGTFWLAGSWRSGIGRSPNAG